MPIRITGISAALKAMKAKEKIIGDGIAAGLKNCAAILLKASQKLVPVDTEALKKSGRVEVKGVGLNATATVEYGGSDAPYAYIVHERLDIPHEPPTQARYLADAVPKVRGTMTAAIRRQLTVKVS